jgi:hypothetical protein
MPKSTYFPTLPTQIIFASASPAQFLCFAMLLIDRFRFKNCKNYQGFNQASVAQLVERLNSDLQTRDRSLVGATFFYKSKDN